MTAYKLQDDARNVVTFCGELIADEFYYDDSCGETVAINNKIYITEDNRYVCERETIASNTKALDDIEILIVTNPAAVRDFFGTHDGTRWFYEVAGRWIDGLN